jgi:hypothetical protein
MWGGCQSGYIHTGAPLSSNVAAIFDGVRRTDRMFLGVRLKVGTSLRLADDCSGARGSALAEYVNSRAAGCLVEEGTRNFTGLNTSAAGPEDPCLAPESAFLDSNLPEYTLLPAGGTPSSRLDLPDRAPSPGPTTSLVRIGAADEAISCERVRMVQF